MNADNRQHVQKSSDTDYLQITDNRPIPIIGKSADFRTMPILPINRNTSIHNNKDLDYAAYLTNAARHSDS